ncbi:MAG: 16S rRNA processing protein RimM [Alphaproteobacteria bacterium]|nr:16S rRNA processing protein RimM [Alphaproteobacteria bacterium]
MSLKNYENSEIKSGFSAKQGEVTPSMIRVMRINGAFGIRGYVRAHLFSDNITSYKKIYDKFKNSFNFRIVRFTGGTGIIVAIDGIDDRDKALALKGSVFYIRKEDLEKTAENEYYVCDLIGKTVEVIEGKNIKCEISNVYNFGAGDLIEISYNNDTFLVPFTKENFPSGDSEEKILITLNAFTCYRN